MSLQTSAGPINAEDADNFEEIEKQFAVKGEPALPPSHQKPNNSRNPNITFFLLI
ncbi:unnamed protein product [Cercospora beticola]|nr:unnamed protein product [Cercospora beticola]